MEPTYTENDLSTVESQLSMVKTYFPALSQKQNEQIEMLYAQYADWNAKINVISRKDINNLYLHHVLHSLGIAKIIDFKAGSSIMRNYKARRDTEE